MRTIMSVFLLAALAVSLCAQDPGVPAAEKKQAAAAVKATVPEAKSAKAATAAPAKKQTDAAEPDDGTVMIDSKADQEEAGRSVAKPVEEAVEREVDVPGGLPVSYGQCKGVINEGGRNLLVFENPDDGTVYLVQVIVGKNGVSWKLAGSIPRSAD